MNLFDFRMMDHILYVQRQQRYECTVEKFPESIVTDYKNAYTNTILRAFFANIKYERILSSIY